MSEVDRALGHLLSGVFIQRAFTKKDKELGDQIISDIKRVFRENLKTLDWMTEKTKEVAAKKGKHLGLRHSSSSLPVAVSKLRLWQLST